MKENEINQEPVEDYYNTLTTDDETLTLSPKNKEVDPLKLPRHKKLTKKNAWIWVIAFLAIILLFFSPFRINILVLGIDPNDQHSAQGRSDTMIMTTIAPFSPKMTMLSIPRDLWVDIPGYGQNRINTAHFFAEVAKPGSGPKAAAEAVEANFHVAFPYTLRIQVEGFKNIVDAMGGVTVTLPTDMSGYTAGVHHLDSTQALAFVRDRKGSDDLYRQMRGQIFLKGAAKQLLIPFNWWRIPLVSIAAARSITTNIPFFLWPRLAYSALFSTVTGFDMNSIDHNMVQGFITSEGADVLLPLWDKINPLVDKLFR
ncbi:MAG: LCP family protein [Anaerolineaceae bacterium]